MKRALLWIPLLALPLSACTALWAQAISKRVGDDLLSLESYEGTLVERGLLPDAKAEVKKTILYQKPWKVRVEVTAPKERAGDLYVYDGNTLTLWWPKELFGVRVAGLQPPTEAAIRKHLELETADNLEAYAFHLVGEVKVAGEAAARWKVIPKKAQPFRLVHHSWMHAEYSLPLRMDFYEEGEKQLWYSMRYETFNAPTQVRKDAFACSFPKNAVVFDWDWRDDPITLAVARETMNFTVRVPKALPAGHSVDKIVRGRHDLPMVSFRMAKGATWISLTQNRAYGGQLSMPMGRRVKIGAQQGYLNFMGPFVVISWTLGDTQLTLIGNVSFPRLLAVARGVE
jgi:outer membrane lipoprotein-sorting protein